MCFFDFFVLENEKVQKSTSFFDITIFGKKNKVFNRFSHQYLVQSMQKRMWRRWNYAV